MITRDVLEAVIRAQLSGACQDPTTQRLNDATSRILNAADVYAGYRPDPAALTQRRREILEAALTKTRERVA